MEKIELHPDVLKACEDKNNRLSDVMLVQDICDVFGSVDKFNKVVDKDKLEYIDVTSINQFVKVVSNYLKMNDINKRK